MLININSIIQKRHSHHLKFMSRKFIASVSTAVLCLAITGGAIWKLVKERNSTIELKLATGSKGGDYYNFGQAIRRVINKNEPRIKLEVIPTNGADENMQLLHDGKVQLALVQNDTATQPSARAIALIYPEVFHLMAREKSEIKTIFDLKGKRLALMPKGSGSYDAFWLLAQHYDLKPTDFQWLQMTPKQAASAFSSGQVDAVFRALPIGNSWTKELIRTTPARMIAIDQAAAIKISYPYLIDSTIPKGTYKAIPAIPDDNLPTVGVQAALITNENIDSNLVRDITSILYEYRHDLVKIEPKAATISQPDIGQNLGLTLHKGAKNYYDREKPPFLAENADYIALLISIATLFISGLWSLRSRFLANQKNRADKYNLEIVALTETARQTDNIEDLETLRQELFKIFREVVQDLDTDRITPESFQSFAFSWQVAINTIYHKEIVALNKLHNPQNLLTNFSELKSINNK